MRIIAIIIATSVQLIAIQSFARDEEPRNIFSVGYADIQFNTNSGEMTGPTGTTPAGVKAVVRDSSTLALVYERRLSGPWSLVFQAGAPPTIHFDGAGTASSLGRVGSAQAWFPALLLAYNFDFYGLKPYVALGANYTWFSDEKMTGAYNTAFAGTSSKVKMDDSIGAVAKVGVEIPLNNEWVAGLSYSRYWIDTTARITTNTPGLGQVKRKVDVDADPDVFSFTVGYRF